MNWYDEYPHIGYDWDGNKIIKPERGDQLDNFMEKMENPDFWLELLVSDYFECIYTYNLFIIGVRLEIYKLDKTSS